MQHWLPYDERRLYGLLGVDRGDTGAGCAATSSGTDAFVLMLCA